jgi:hypothetical protein
MLSLTNSVIINVVNQCIGAMRTFSRVLEMAKKSVGGLTEEDLKGKR